MYSDIIARSDSVKDAVSRLGVLKSLVLHSADSTRESTNATRTIFTAITMTDVPRDTTVMSDAIPQGKNRDPTMAMNMVSLIIEDSSIMASPRPEYSRIIASWTMVSSRWVVGLSKGILAFSARSVIMNDAPARISAGVSAANPISAMLAEIPPMSVPAPDMTARV